MRRSKKTSRNGRSRTSDLIVGCRHRRVLPGSTYLVTKKCSDDLLLIVPSPLVNQVLLYLLVLKAIRHGIVIHSYCFMSNHFHLVVTDFRARLPEFMREFLGESSKAIQVVCSSDRPIWSRKRYSAVRLLDLEAAQRKDAYSCENPVRGGLTLPADWPGITSASYRSGETIVADRPDVYFSKRRPKRVSIVLTSVAIAFEPDGTTKEERERIAAASDRRIRLLIADGVERCLVALSRRGRSLLGAKGALRESRTKRGARRVRHLNPRFATRNRVLMSVAIAESRQFEIEHERAKRRFIAGDRTVRFPTGTYGYRKLFGVRVKAVEAA